MPTLVDSNVLLDVLTDDTRWGAWSAEALAACAEHDVLTINPIIYAEVSIGFTRIEDLDVALAAPSLQRLPLPWEAAFLAGKFYVAYRKRGGSRSAPLTEF
jgi:predicted nucleic acid-binding protein